MADAKSTKKKQRRSVPAGQLHIQATFNNTRITGPAKVVAGQPAAFRAAVVFDTGIGGIP